MGGGVGVGVGGDVGKRVVGVSVGACDRLTCAVRLNGMSNSVLRKNHPAT